MGERVVRDLWLTERELLLESQGRGSRKEEPLVSLKTLLILAVVALVAWKIYLLFGHFFLNYPRPTL